jgi:hypothetical protein
MPLSGSLVLFRREAKSSDPARQHAIAENPYTPVTSTTARHAHYR